MKSYDNNAGESRRRAPQDVVGGIVLMAVAVVAFIAARDLGTGRGFSFGSGTVPRLFAGFLGLTGFAIAVAGMLGAGPRLERFPWRGPVFLLGAIVFFGLSIRSLGLAVTGVITIMIASAAIDDVRPVETAIFAVVMTTFCALIFPIALNQPIPLWPTIKF